MKHYLYIMSDTKKQSIHLGYCKDILKAVAFFKQMPTLLFSPERQNILVHLEIADNEDVAKKRFDEVFGINLVEKHELIFAQNPDFIELLPNLNIEI